MRQHREAATADERKLRDALRTIIAGREVKRIRHDLLYEGRDVTEVFVDELRRAGYRPAIVAKVDLQPGERVPGFLVRDGVAYFGWIFWEQFTSTRLRKLWGSVLKNKLGDWEIQIPATRSTILYANASLKLEMDIDHPPEW